MRARVVNPKWIAGVMRHGYKGAFEIAATVDYLFAFAATARVVDDHHFEALYDAYLADDQVRGFIAEANPAALREIAERFQEAIERGLWRPASNSAHRSLESLSRRTTQGSRRQSASGRAPVVARTMKTSHSMVHLFWTRGERPCRIGAMRPK